MSITAAQKTALNRADPNSLPDVFREIAIGTKIDAYETSRAAVQAGTIVAALVDSSGGAAANGTIGVVTAPTALTDNGGGTADATVASMAAPVTLTDSTGDSATSDDILADGLTATAPAAVTNYAAVVNMTNPVTKTEGEAVSAALATLENEVTALTAVVAACVTDLTAQNQNDSDLAQKVIEIVTWMATVQDNMKELTTAQAANRLAIVALTDAVTEITTKLEAMRAALVTAGILASA